MWELSLAATIAVTVVMILAIAWRPALVRGMGGRVFAFVAFFLLPALLALMATSTHVEHSKETDFCLSCHVMEPYGHSLYIDGKEHLPASHFQNRRVPRDQACFTCHTNYAMFGDVKAKLNGLKHMWVYYIGEIPEKIELYEKYNNRECLHCHEGARSFLESSAHEDVLAEMRSGEISCLECHEVSHDIANLKEHSTWKPGGSK